MGKLSATFLAISPARDVDPGALEALLAARLQEARARWTAVALDEERFIAHLAGHAPREGDLLAAVRARHTSDLYLACGCAHGVPGAVESFHAHLLSRLPILLAGLRLDSAALDDARQLVSQRLLLPRPDGPPRIADYSGRGSLEGWLRIAAIRTVLNEREKERERERAQYPLDESKVQGLFYPSGGAELALIRARHGEDLAAALRAALEGLTAREQTLLKLHFLKGVPAGDLGRMYGVHRTTVGRWIDAAQAALLAATQRILASRLRLSDSECSSLIRALRSNLDLTLRSLADRAPAGSTD